MPVYKYTPGEISQCVACSGKVCSDCGVALKQEDTIETHKCNEDDLKSVAAIHQSTTPCPCCKAPVHKISGCDHMFCSVCKSSFSYRTGKQSQHSFGNPHHDAFVRSLSEEERSKWMDPINRQNLETTWCEDQASAQQNFYRRLRDMRIEFSDGISEDSKQFVYALHSLMGDYFTHRRNTLGDDESVVAIKRQRYMDKLSRGHIEYNEPSKESYILQLARHKKKYQKEEETTASEQNFMNTMRRVVLSMSRWRQVEGQHRWGNHRAEFLMVTQEFVRVSTELYVACYRDIQYIIQSVNSHTKNSLDLTIRCGTPEMIKLVFKHISNYADDIVPDINTKRKSSASTDASNKKIKL